MPLTATVDGDGVMVDFSICQGTAFTSLAVANNGPGVVYARSGSTVTTEDTAVAPGSYFFSPALVVSLITEAGGSATATLTPVE